MPIPPKPELELAAKEMVWSAKKQGNLREFTTRLVRRALEKEYRLEDGTLDEADFKSVINSATKAALNETPPLVEDEGSATKPNSSPLKKRRKSNEIVKATKVKAGSTSKGKGKAKSKAVEEGDDATEEEQGSAKKKRKVTHDKKSVDVGKDRGSSSSLCNPKTQQRQKEKEVELAEHVSTSDVEHDEPADLGKLKGSPPKLKSSNTSASPKKRAKLDSSKGKGKTLPEKDEGSAKMDDPGAKSESELSVLDDETPNRKKKSKSVEKLATKASKSKGQKDNQVDNKDEATIKRLKSLVLACGLRKVWSRAFQGLNTPQEQIKKLKEILAELGMTGRMSMEQAKAIKERRELAQELEDVQAFAKAIETRESRTRSRTLTKGSRIADQSEDDDDDPASDDSEIPDKKRPMNARKSIMAFLRDQSTDDE